VTPLKSPDIMISSGDSRKRAVKKKPGRRPKLDVSSEEEWSEESD
jgi:hypothetical protein